MMLRERWLIKKKFKILNINHVAVATENTDILKFLFSDILGMSFEDKECVKSENVNVVKIYAEDKNTAIELLEPTSEVSNIKNFLTLELN